MAEAMTGGEMPPETEDRVTALLEALRGEMRRVADSVLSSHQALTADVSALRGEVETLRRRVDGSKPPPPDAPPVAVVAARADARASSADLSTAALEGRVLAVDARVSALSGWRAVGPGLVRLWSDPDARRDSMRVLTLVSAVLAAAGTLFASCGRPVPAVLPVPAPMVSEVLR